METHPSNITTKASDVVNMKTNATSALGDESTLLESIVNTFNAVRFHCQKKAAAKGTHKKTGYKILFH